jgi:hypothetical protein
VPQAKGSPLAPPTDAVDPALPPCEEPPVEAALLLAPVLLEVALVAGGPCVSSPLQAMKAQSVKSMPTWKRRMRDYRTPTA